MQLDANPSSGVSLPGEWITSAALERLNQLGGELDRLLKTDPRPSRVAIDLAGVKSLDACGCQLLALFLGNLKRYGIEPEPCCIPAELGEQIRLLGFQEVLTPAQAQEKENS
jgi:anti-anti-sigma regulatory factor